MDNFEKTQRTTLYAGIFLCAVYFVYLVVVYSFSSVYPSDHVTRIYQFGLFLFTIMYIVQENRHRQYVYNPHELGFFVWIFWPVYMPYYFVKSRGAKGLGVFAILVALLIMDSIVDWIWYALSQDVA